MGKNGRHLWLLLALAACLLSRPSTSGAVQVGETAPDFTLPSTWGEEISLSDYRGKTLVLLQFYAIDFRPVWMANLSTRKVDIDKFSELEVQVLGIAASPVFAQKTFADSLKLPFPLLADLPALNVIHSYELGIEYEGKIIARPAFILIDKDGIVRGLWVSDDSPEAEFGADEIFPSKPILDLAREIQSNP